ncbi:sialidase family protein [Dyadobacter jejuensis]|nr:sialidase family protein [Dyadobacter jejuensis]
MNLIPRSLTLGLMAGGLALFSACQSTKKEEQADENTVNTSFVFGDERPFPECHASTVVRLPDGNFITAWFGGTKEKDPDVGIWMSKGQPGNWSAPVEIAKIREDAHWNPVLQVTDGGQVILYYKVGKEIARWETWVQTSDDGGDSWSEAYELVPGDKGGRGPVKDKLIVLTDGTWLAGASDEQDGWKVFVDRSEDQGKTWTRSPFFKIDTMAIKGKGAIQPTLWESAPGKVHMLVRTTGGKIGRSDSDDNGKTWSEIVATSLPNPNSGIDLDRLEDGSLVLAYNPDDSDWGSRSPLSLAMSEDNGTTWPVRFDLDKGDKEDEFSYPAVIAWGDSVAVTYTWNRQKIAFWKGSKADVVALSK